MAQTDSMARMVGYCRVSTETQARSGLGLDSQRAAISAAAAREGWEIVAWETDRGETGKNTNRAAFRAAMARVADGTADGLVAAKLDRVCRSVIDFAELLAWFSAAGRALVVLDPQIDTTTASGRLVANVFAAVAEWEADTIAERTKAAAQANRAAGKTISRPAVVDDRPLADQIRRLRTEGMTLRAIAAQLNDEGVPTRRHGTEWRASSVQAAVGYERPKTVRKSADLPAVPRRTRRKGPLS